MSVHKSQLHELVQKLSWPPPHYESVKEGAAHLPHFQASVEVNGVTYQSRPGFPTVKAAEHDAARVALEAISSGVGDQQQPVHRSGLCKNVVQEFAQKSGMPLPVYKTVKTGEDHHPTFTTTVDVGGMLYCGGPAKSRKEAEIKAAKTAMVAIETLKIAPSNPAPPVHAPPPSLPSPEMQGRKRARTRDPRNFMREMGVRIKLENPPLLSVEGLQR